ncbi:hypothetical protein DL767_006225 [Monosporascus sp. MG133]|nr:hypothetical protein DL767_006225 [Monosporascus sp. MG133]
MERLVEPQVLKLAIMAVESRSVDPTDEDSLEKFFTNYVHHDEWPRSHFRLSTAAQLPELQNMTRELKESAQAILFHGHPLAETPSEHIRKMRAYYIVETAANLFHRWSMEDAPVIWAPFPRFLTLYWLNFSWGEVSMIRSIGDHFRTNLRTAFSVSTRYGTSGCVCWDEHNWGEIDGRPLPPMTVFCVFAHNIGIEKLHRAVFGIMGGTPFRSLHDGFLLYDDLYDAFEPSTVWRQVPETKWYPLLKQLDPPPFCQDDPGSWKEETYDWSLWDDWPAYFNNSDVYHMQRWIGTEALWDKASLEAWREKLRRGEIE